MKVQIQFPHNAGSVEVDTDTLPAATMEWAIAYGIRQGVVDAAAGAAKFAADNHMTREDAVRVLIEKRLARMFAGTVAVRESSDPLGAAINQVLSKRIAGWAKMDADAKAKARAAVRDGTSETAQALRAEAERIVAAGARMASKIDADALLG